MHFDAESDGLCCAQNCGEVIRETGCNAQNYVVNVDCETDDAGTPDAVLDPEFVETGGGLGENAETIVGGTSFSDVTANNRMGYQPQYIELLPKKCWKSASGWCVQQRTWRQPAWNKRRLRCTWRAWNHRCTSETRRRCTW